jgi:hypothetical protein
MVHHETGDDALSGDPPHLSEVQLRGFLGALVAALDTGKYEHILMVDVERHLEDGDLVAWLTEQLGEDGDFLLTSEAAADLGAKCLDLWHGYCGQEWRKWGIRRSGLCLLVAWGLTLLGDIDYWGRIQGQMRRERIPRDHRSSLCPGGVWSTQTARSDPISGEPGGGWRGGAALW